MSQAWRAETALPGGGPGDALWSSLHSVRVRAGGASLNFDAGRWACCFYLCPGRGDLGLCLPPRRPGEQVSRRQKSRWEVGEPAAGRSQHTAVTLRGGKNMGYYLILFQVNLP